ncbi:hypothetical protein [Xanthomonas axonopodis]|uniref:hypothetical protein n=1 Tax=Xanthomonas axonopodis TaxID=53413 RepID=UPI0035562019
MPPFKESGLLGALHDLAVTGHFDSPQSNRLIAGYASGEKLRIESAGSKIDALERQCSESNERFHKRDKEAALLEAELAATKSHSAISKLLLTLAALTGNLAIKQIPLDKAAAYTLFAVTAILALFGYIPNAAKAIKGIFKQ